MSYECNQLYQQNVRRLQTSGNAATFIMQRENVEQYNYDVEIRVTPIRGGS